MKHKKNRTPKYLTLTQILEQNPISCGNCSNFKTVKGTHKLYAKCKLGLMKTGKKYWIIERKYSRMPLSWEEAKICRYFIGENHK
ncbi:MAG: hypothetical protein DDT18_00885 [Actinobacteria bacterium]|nr:hypothetical protein [Actinomycetota bacterium]